MTRFFSFFRHQNAPFPFERGAALISVLAIIALVATVLPLVLSDIQLEYAESHHKLNRLKATYNARSAAELSLLRILIYKEAQKHLKRSNSKLPEEMKSAMSFMIPSLLDMIWREPIIWPLPIPENLLESEKRDLLKITKESFVRGSYLAHIQPEDGKVDLNDLASTLEPLRLFTHEMLSNLLLLEEEEERNYTEKEVIQALSYLTDWIDPDQESQTGGVEESPEGTPLPNRSLISIEEIQRLPGMTNALYKALKPHITVYGSKGLNINYTHSSLLQALGFPPELIEEILARTNPASQFYQRFQDVTEFCDWLSERGFDMCRTMEDHFHTRDLLQFNTPLHFRVQATGQFKTSVSKVESLTYDTNQATTHFQIALESEKNRLYPPSPDSPDKDKDTDKDQASSEQKKKNTLPSRPYKTSSPLLIMYWKEKF